MKTIFIRLSAIWALMRGHDFILTTLHSKGKYVVTHKDCINVATYEVMYKFIEAVTRHLDEIKTQMQHEEGAI
ncbi:hypothetical protein [Lepagella muris]|uniref:hypothetical protein n=1 Tax=Lepagella muris TaxID=3032870 RepID=UPI0010941F10|nr:hypothetical protein [Lepagella muris]TKC57406.1 hypothetical protein E5359_012125 [Bacteroidales bacterium]